MTTIQHAQYTEIIADEGNFLYRKSDEGKPNFFSRGAMLAGETTEDFAEVTQQQREDIELQYQEEMPELTEQSNE